jgi:hypothetical protein
VSTERANDDDSCNSSAGAWHSEAEKGARVAGSGGSRGWARWGPTLRFSPRVMNL